MSQSVGAGRHHHEVNLAPSAHVIETILQSSWHVLITATPPAPDASLGSAETLLTYREGEKSLFQEESKH